MFSKKGFTLIELLVVIVIIGILSGFIIVSMNSAINASKDAKRKSDIGTLQRSLMIYGVQNNNTYPSTDTYPCTIGGGTTPCTNLATDLLPYIASLPTDPNGGYYTYNYADGNFTLSTMLSSGDYYSYSSSDGFGSFVCGNPFTDTRNSKTYNTVQIGTQCWMKENLDYDNGCSSETWVNNTDVGWCGYYTGGPFANEGLLYQWSAAMADSTTEGAQGICPTGWHVPTDAELVALEQYTVSVIGSVATQYACDTILTGWRRCADNDGTDAGGPLGAGKSLKKVGQGSGVGAGNDLVGFSGLLSGGRNIDGTFVNRTTS
jgi:type II secretion system protein G